MDAEDKNMKRASKMFGLGVGIFSLLLFVGDVHAECGDNVPSGVFCYASWEWDPTMAAIGRDPNDSNTQWIGWWNLNTYDCEWDQIGDSNGLWDDTTLTGGWGDDYFSVVPSGGWSFCGRSLAPPIYGGNLLYFDSASYDGGYDTVYSYAAGFSFSGSSGGNYVHSERGDVNIYGGYSPDWVIISGSATIAGSIQTYGGDDYVYVTTSVNSPTVNCGGPNDSDLWCGPGTRPASCEATIQPCP